VKPHAISQFLSLNVISHLGGKLTLRRTVLPAKLERMRESAPAVRSQNSTLRYLMLFCSIGHFTFAAVLLIGRPLDFDVSSHSPENAHEREGDAV
jgi:hypothetical protein